MITRAVSVMSVVKNSSSMEAGTALGYDLCVFERGSLNSGAGDLGEPNKDLHSGDWGAKYGRISAGGRDRGGRGRCRHHDDFELGTGHKVHALRDLGRSLDHHFDASSERGWSESKREVSSHNIGNCEVMM